MPVSSYSHPQGHDIGVSHSQAVSVVGGDVHGDLEFKPVFGAQSEVEGKLEELQLQIEELLQLLPPEKRLQAQGDLEQFKQQVRAPYPDRRYLSVSGQGLVDAAKAVGEAAPPIFATVRGILGLIKMASIVLL